VPSLEPRAGLRRSDGFSLIEALVATGIFVAGALGLVQLVTLAVASNAAARHQSEAAMLASDTVEQLLAAPWGAETGGDDEANGYRRHWTISPLPDVDDGVVLDVRVSGAGIPDVHLVAVKTRSAP
jgi:Tfp pilus assembly protein PilV